MKKNQGFSLLIAESKTENSSLQRGRARSKGTAGGGREQCASAGGGAGIEVGLMHDKCKVQRRGAGSRGGVPVQFLACQRRSLCPQLAQLGRDRAGQLSLR
jgi:hypothetical protein